MVNKIYEILLIVDEEKKVFILGDMMYQLKQTDIGTRIIEDFYNLLDGNYDQISTMIILFDELSIAYFINEAIQVKIREYKRAYFTKESLDLLLIYL